MTMSHESNAATRSWAVVFCEAMNHVGSWFGDGPPNKSLDASGGDVFRIMTGPAIVD